MINYNYDSNVNPGLRSGCGNGMSTGPGQFSGAVGGAVNPSLLSQQMPIPYNFNTNVNVNVDHVAHNQDQFAQTFVSDNYINLLNAARYQAEIFHQQEHQQQLLQHQMTSQSLFPYACNDFTLSLMEQDFLFTPTSVNVNDMPFFSFNQLQIHSQSQSSLNNSLNSSPAKSQSQVQIQPIDLYNNNNNNNRSSPFSASAVSAGDSSSPFQFHNPSSSSSSSGYFEQQLPQQLQGDLAHGQGQLLEAQNGQLKTDVVDVENADIHERIFERLENLDFGVIPSKKVRLENIKFRKPPRQSFKTTKEERQTEKRIRKRRLEQLIRRTIAELVTYDESTLAEMIATNLKASKDLIAMAVEKLGKAHCAKLFIKTLRLYKRSDGAAIRPNSNGEKKPHWENFMHLAYNSNLPKPILNNICNMKKPKGSSLILNCGPDVNVDVNDVNVNVSASAKRPAGLEGKMKLQQQPILLSNDLKREDCKCRSAKHFDLIAFLLKE